MAQSPTDEKPETKEQRAQDVVYTVNHAIACTLTDIGSPFIGNWTQRYLGKRFEPGCGHDHSQNHPAHDHGHDHDHSHAPAAGHLGHWWIGEAVGDFGAVPITIALDRHAPKFMEGLRNLMEPVLGPLFRIGANRAAKRWAQDNFVAPGSQAEKNKAQEIYSYEIEHLPQAVVWTATSTVLNVATQKAVGNKGPLWQIGAGKLSGAAFSSAVVVGGRTMFPGKAQGWEQTASRKVVLPVTKAVSRAFGIDSGTVERIARQDEEKEGGWEKRVDAPPAAAASR